ncbi:MAG: biotin--[acetyl-CoA-carboxylase] ligase [bacterium]
MADWQANWEVPLLEIHETLTSTNSRARDLLREGGSSFSTVIAQTQTEGRGRNGNYWHSPKDMGLWMSFLLRHSIQDPPNLVSTLTGLAVVDAIDSVSDTSRLGIKWPNDIEINGKKVGGILCETCGRESVVVGIGLNVIQEQDDFPAFLAEKVTSIGMASGKAVSLAELAGSILLHCKILLDPLPTVLPVGLIEKLERRSTLIGMKVPLSDGQEGSVLGFSPLGAMLVMAEGSLRHINSTSAVRSYTEIPK